MLIFLLMVWSGPCRATKLHRDPVEGIPAPVLHQCIVDAAEHDGIISVLRDGDIGKCKGYGDRCVSKLVRNPLHLHSGIDYLCYVSEYSAWAIVRAQFMFEELAQFPSRSPEIVKAYMDLETQSLEACTPRPNNDGPPFGDIVNCVAGRYGPWLAQRFRKQRYPWL